jgi:hypothetical protein
MRGSASPLRSPKRYSRHRPGTPAPALTIIIINIGQHLPILAHSNLLSGFPKPSTALALEQLSTLRRSGDFRSGAFHILRFVRLDLFPDEMRVELSLSQEEV